MYGRLQNGICLARNFLNVNCTASTSFDVISYRCNGKETCEVKAANSWFGDPCVGVVKYLDIKYECWTSKCLFIYRTFPATKHSCTLKNRYK